MPEPRAHWLVETARRVGLPASFVDRKATPEAAWTAVTQTAGIGQQELAQRLAAMYRLKVADLSTAEPHAVALVPEKVARQYGVFPLRQTDRELVVAVSNPADLAAEQDLRFASGRSTVFEVAPPAAIRAAIDRHYSAQKTADSLLERIDDSLAAAIRVVSDSHAEPVKVQVEEAQLPPIVKLTNLIIANAIRDGASDIHLEPERDGAIVRFRVDGVLRAFMRLPLQLFTRVVSRIKIMGRMDIAEHLLPQDGHIRMQMMGRMLDLRISSVPACDAEKVVIRLADSGSANRLEDLSLPARELAQLRHLLGHRDGIVLVTGPTGSGKTTLLYAALRELATGAINIMTVEDPIEKELPGTTQIQVEPKRGLTFAAVLRSILRQDPDVILVGEMRDLETAQTAVQASLTGHLVLGTIHANDATAATMRLADLGVDSSKIAATFRGAVAQRLARRVCRACAQPVGGTLTQEEERLAARYGIRPVVRAVGCADCGRSGYRGRLPILEVLVVSEEIETLIAAGAPLSQIQRMAVQEGGMRQLRDVAVERVLAGETTLDEMDRVLGEAMTKDESAAARERQGPPLDDLAASAVLTRPSEAPAAREPHVLVVDDDAVSRTLAKAVLEKNGFQVAEAIDGVAALEHLEVYRNVQLMVLDLDMPHLGGLEVLARVRRAVATATLPVVVLTGTMDEEAEVAAIERGADDYVRKPLDPPRFVARVKAALRRAAS
ncbi:MAG TPA: ATPase, T2SS/T4P/T4SS family [Thermoanaerobaculia bacterium]|nr:ATPase, T2SS/T4P/T4SS family [Thermoanaerobaculia bacterium]